ncbi:hypothetical protein SFLOR_v1c07530 [Spiroplasma floricola 23-6]|uniref:Uncharacterized protein n=1 Tax=Spiroplasma floricola 23-6 TaxID=1336749 RepID=A0A2K8SEB5_9MOLU|nr:hypothetical protein SFLOR_v1c07530 [Spiroplasma floricola 23-6]
MTSILIYVFFGLLLMSLGFLIYFLIKKTKSIFCIKRGIVKYFLDTIPIIFFVAGLLTIVCGCFF